ncbi:MAG: DUF4365 domain-containing protein [Puniceicoccales bacterium]
MKTIPHVKESLSLSVLSAIVATARQNLARVNEHDYGVDGTIAMISMRGNKITENGIKIDFQAKSSVKWEFDGDKIVYDLEVDAYNAIVARSKNKRVAPLYLVLLALPKDQKDWSEFTEDYTRIRNCMYFTVLDGEESTNSQQVRIRIERGNLFTPDKLLDLLKELEEEYQ